MPDTKNDLPEGTDTVIAGAGTTSDPTSDRSGTGMQGGTTSQQGNATGGRTAVTGSSNASSDSSRDLIATGSSGTSGGGSADMGGSGSGGQKSGVRGFFSNASSKARDEAANRARSFLGQGLERGGTTLTNVSQLVNDTVEQIEEKLGPQYGEYARTASQTLERYAQTLTNKNPDELVDDVRTLVRKSPGAALGAAAVVGFSIVRIIKAGLEDQVGNRTGSTGGSGGVTGGTAAIGTGTSPTAGTAGGTAGTSAGSGGLGSSGLGTAGGGGTAAGGTGGSTGAGPRTSQDF